MREIMFKAKRTENREWVEGYPLPSIAGKELNRMTVFQPFPGGTVANTYKVDPKTICQYTGLTDKNGVKIFEGDIVSILDSNRQGLPAPVCFLKDQCQFVLARSGYNPIWMSEVDPEKEFEVVGNIHDKEG